MRLLNKILKALRIQNLTIRFRMISAGTVLTLCAVSSLLFFMSQTKSLLEFYEKKNRLWDTMHKSDELMKKINKTEAYIEPIENDDLKTLDMFMKFIAENASKSDTQIVSELNTYYEQWKVKSTESPTQERRRIVLEMQQRSSKLEASLTSQNEDSKKELSNKIKFIRKIVAYGGVMFIVGFMFFLYSVWYTIMPDLSILVHATHEFKQGNLNYRAHIEGKTETAELASAFNNMVVEFKDQTEKLHELNRLKTDFVSTVSHELRTPLTAIKGSIGLILGGVTGPLENNDLKQMLEITQKNTDRLIRLINDVLDIAKIEAGMIRLNFDKYSLDALILQAIEGVEGFARTHEVNLQYEKIEEKPLVVLDHDRILQVITNLLSNAIKFTEQGGYVKVKTELMSDKVLIHVSDNGRGISQEFLNRMWDKFQQEESASNKNMEGTGLGLAIVKGFVEEHGGKIWCTSKVGEGSRFTFTIPWNGVDLENSEENHSSFNRAA